MLPALCDDQRFILGLVSGAASVIFGLAMINVGPNLLYLFTRSGEHPRRSHPLVWALCGLTGLIAVAVPALTGAAPSRVCANVRITRFECAPEGDDLELEYVEIANAGNIAQPMNGWLLCDQQGRHCYTFEIFTLPAGSAVKVWTKTGTDTDADLYWGHRMPIWTNTGDTAILRDHRGALVDEAPCP